MRKCPYCGKDNADNAERCERCFAGFPSEKKEVKDQPKKVDKKLTRSEKYGS